MKQKDTIKTRVANAVNQRWKGWDNRHLIEMISQSNKTRELGYYVYDYHTQGICSHVEDGVYTGCFVE